MSNVIFTIFLIFTFSACASEQYSVIGLPDGFDASPHSHSSRRPLNNYGQVAGTANKKAAFWDVNIGLFLIPIEGESSSVSLNDSALICAEKKENESNIRKVLLWDTVTNDVIFGPEGTPLTINNLNDVLFSSYSINTWNSNSGVISYSIGDVVSINNNGSFLYNRSEKNITPVCINDRGNILCRRSAEVLFYTEGKYYLISLPNKLAGQCFLNNLDEVVGLVYSDDKKMAFFKWKKDRKASFSSALGEMPELRDYIYHQIMGINDSGQILLRSTKKDGPYKEKLFLLTPKNG